MVLLRECDFRFKLSRRNMHVTEYLNVSTGFLIRSAYTLRCPKDKNPIGQITRFHPIWFASRCTTRGPVPPMHGSCWLRIERVGWPRTLDQPVIFSVWKVAPEVDHGTRYQVIGDGPVCVLQGWFQGMSGGVTEVQFKLTVCFSPGICRR